jgi:hypothetical protein
MGKIGFLEKIKRNITERKTKNKNIK